MNNKLRMFGVSVLILTLITAAILGLLISPANPMTWLLVASLAVVPLLHRRLKSHQHLEWKSDYSVGIASIDAQHRKLIDLINSLQTAVDYSTGEAFERKALDELVDYTKTHFKFEEDMMEQNGYPDFESHRESHVRMIAKVDEVIEAYRRDQDGAMQQALDFLKDWLINHINGTDKQYSSFLIDKGVS
jgi:hemerythrin-like metal-binding protein